MEQNPYVTPNSELMKTSHSNNHNKPSIDEAIERGYNFGIMDLISQAQHRIS